MSKGQLHYKLNLNREQKTVPHYLQDHTEKMQHCVVEIHFLN